MLLNHFITATTSPAHRSVGSPVRSPGQRSALFGGVGGLLLVRLLAAAVAALLVLTAPARVASAASAAVGGGADDDAADLAFDDFQIVYPSKAVILNLREGGSLMGQLTFYSERGLRVEVRGEEKLLPWSAFKAGSVQAVARSLIDASDGGGWLMLGRIMSRVPGGEEQAESALAVAGRLDPGLEAEVAEARATLARLVAEREAARSGEAGTADGTRGGQGALDGGDEGDSADGDAGGGVADWPLPDEVSQSRAARFLRDAVRVHVLARPTDVLVEQGAGEGEGAGNGNAEGHGDGGAGGRVRVAAYCMGWVGVLDDQRGSVRRLWASMPADTAELICRQIIDPGNAAELAKAGLILTTVPGGTARAEQMFHRAVQLDAAMGPLIDEALDLYREHRDAFEAFHAEASRLPGSFDARGPAPRWPDLTDADRARITEALKAQVEAKLDELGLGLEPLETDYWVMYSDLAGHDRQKWLRQLDQMYDRVLSMFDVPAGTNIWHGKCIVFVFADDRDYREFYSAFFGQGAPGAAKGLCTQFGDGRVYVTFHHDPGDPDREFGHLFVHEATHGVIHRLYSPVPIPSWLNEGLAEYWALQINGFSQRVRYRQQQARERVKRSGDMAGYFTAAQIQPWEYGLAYDFVDYLLDRDRVGTFDAFREIKAGRPWVDAFTQGYGTPLTELVEGYGRERLGVRGLANRDLERALDGR